MIDLILALLICIIVLVIAIMFISYIAHKSLIDTTKYFIEASKAKDLYELKTSENVPQKESEPDEIAVEDISDKTFMERIRNSLNKGEEKEIESDIL